MSKNYYISHCAIEEYYGYSSCELIIREQSYFTKHRESVIYSLSLLLEHAPNCRDYKIVVWDDDSTTVKELTSALMSESDSGVIDLIKADGVCESEDIINDTKHLIEQREYNRKKKKEEAEKAKKITEEELEFKKYQELKEKFEGK